MNYISRYKEKGFFIIRNVLDSSNIDEIYNEVTKITSSKKNAKVIYEDDNHNIRSIMSYHSKNKVLKHYTEYQLIMTIVSRILNETFYVSQSKINLKSPKGKGKKWDYHRGFTFWNILDGKPRQEMVSVFIFLSKQTILNGAVYVLEGSHQGYNIKTMKDESIVCNDQRRNDTAESLSIQINQEHIATYKSKYKKVYLLGQPGDVVFMHPALLHASDNNMFSKSRDLMVTVFNSTKNLPTKNSRPNYLCERDFAPIEF